MKDKKFSPLDYEPQGKMILIEPTHRPKETESGLELPDEAYRPTATRAVILSVGPESKYKVNQTVLFTRYANDDLPFHDEGGIERHVHFISDDEVIAVQKQDA